MNSIKLIISRTSYPTVCFAVYLFSFAHFFSFFLLLLLLFSAFFPIRFGFYETIFYFTLCHRINYVWGWFRLYSIIDWWCIFQSVFFFLLFAAVVIEISMQYFRLLSLSRWMSGIGWLTGDWDELKRWRKCIFTTDRSNGFQRLFQTIVGCVANRLELADAIIQDTLNGSAPHQETTP